MAEQNDKTTAEMIYEAGVFSGKQELKMDYRPNQIVLVKHEDYAHYGEVISRKTPEGTYMVRMVPGDPSTMIEVPMDMIVRPVQPVGLLKWVHYAEVNGSGQFPVDMLRYDHCAPVNFKLRAIAPLDSGSIEIVPNDPTDTRLIIAKLARTKTHSPWTELRWSSFLWGIKPLKVLKLGSE